MKANFSVTQTQRGNIVTICVPENDEHGRVDIEFEFRLNEQGDFLSLQKSLLENQVGITIQPKKP